MKRYYFLIIIILLGIFLFNTGNSNAQDLALNKPYIMSVAPNYSLSAPPSDITSLTDGVFSVMGRFWTQRTTVGWQGKLKVRIIIDLGKTQPVGTVKFSSAAGTADVYFPQNIYVFLSDDNKQYAYAGDLMSASEGVDTSYGVYRKMNFELDEINTKARYILVEAIPRNTYLFCDEIQVLKGSMAISLGKLKLKLFDISNLSVVEDSLKSYEMVKKNLLSAFQRLPETVQKNSGFSDRKIMEGIPQNVQPQIGRIYGSYLQTSFNTAWIIEKVNPWSAVNRFYLPASAGNTITYQLKTPANSVQYGSFTITNTSQLQQALSVSMNNQANFTNHLSLFESPFVPAPGGKMIADPLIPVKDKITLDPGMTKLIFFRLEGIKPGSYSDTLIITGLGKRKTIIVDSQIMDAAALNKDENLSANVWAYFTYPMLKDVKTKAAKDLHEHHVNTIVIPPAVIPFLNISDYSKLTEYLKGAGKFEKVLLFSNYSALSIRNGYKGAKFLSDEWKNYFKKWYAGILNTLKGLGYSPGEIYFYPYDEVSGKANIENFTQLIQWAKKNAKDIQFYATLQNEEAIQAITPLVDIAQIHFPAGSKKILPKHSSQIWTYDTYAPARTLPAYSYYRLMAWTAFANGYQGIGFWNYAASDSNTITMPLQNPSKDYSVIYTGPDSTIYSTRRWEAFRLGIEDYRILKSYSKKFGFQKAIELADKVLAQPENFDLADEVRNEMLRQL